MWKYDCMLYVKANMNSSHSFKIYHPRQLPHAFNNFVLTIYIKYQQQKSGFYEKEREREP